MSTFHGVMPRRALLQGAGAGLSAGLLAGLTGSTFAQAGAAEGDIWSKDYWAKKGDVSLNRANRRGRSSSWCTALRTRRAPLTTSRCRAGANIR
jgi:hypothetical protein